MMTREEAIKHIRSASKMVIDNGYTSDIVDACDMVVKALERNTYQNGRSSFIRDLIRKSDNEVEEEDEE